MRTHHLSLLATTLLTAALLTPTATGQQNYDLWAGTTHFTSRGNLGANSGELHQGFHRSIFRGLAGNGGGTANGSGGGTPAVCRMVFLRALNQDQNIATAESFDWVIRSGDDLNGPTAGSAGLIGGVLGVSTPTGANTAAAFFITTTLTTPVDVPCDDFFAIGQAMTTSPNWSADGQSTHMSAHDSAARANNNAWMQEATRVPTSPRELVEHAWQFIGTATVATHPSLYRSWRYGFGTNGATLELGNGGAYGPAGSFPLPSSGSTSLAYTARLSGGSSFASAKAVVTMFPLGYAGNPVSLGTGADLWCIFGAELYLFGTADATGTAIIPIAPSVPFGLPKVNIPFQGAMDNFSTLKITNAQSLVPDA